MINGEYRIKVKGLLDETRAVWFEGWSIAYEKDDITVLTGQPVDQSALYGTLEKIRNLNLSIISVDSTESEE